MVVTVYATSDALKDRLGFTENDSREGALIAAIASASRWIDQQTGRRFYVASSSEVRYYTAAWRYPQSGSFGDFPWGNPERPFGGGLASLQLNIDDAVAVTEVATDTDGDGTYETAWTLNTDYFLAPRNAIALGKAYRQIHRNQVTGRYMYPPYENAIRITGSFASAATTPADIRMLCMMVAELMMRPLLDLSIAGTQTYKIGLELNVTMSSEQLPPLGQAILEQWRDPLFG